MKKVIQAMAGSNVGKILGKSVSKIRHTAAITAGIIIPKQTLTILFLKLKSNPSFILLHNPF